MSVSSLRRGELQGPWVCTADAPQPSLLEATSGRDGERSLGGDGGQSWVRGDGAKGMGWWEGWRKEAEEEGNAI